MLAERIGELVTGIEPGLPDAQQLPVTPMHTGRRPGAVLVLVNADLDPPVVDVVTGCLR